MKHNAICCAHCGNSFDFSGFGPDYIYHGNSFKAACAKCNEIHLFTVHILHDVMTFEGVEEESMMIDPIPLRSPPQVAKPRPPVNPLGEEMLKQAQKVKLKAVEEDEEIRNYSQETLENLQSVFDPDAPKKPLEDEE